MDRSIIDRSKTEGDDEMNIHSLFIKIVMPKPKKLLRASDLLGAPDGASIYRKSTLAEPFLRRPPNDKPR